MGYPHRLRQTCPEEARANLLARVCASGGAHCDWSARNHFESDAGLSERFCQFAAKRRLSWIDRHKPNDLMSFPGSGDQQRMDFFVEMLRLGAQLVDVADLRGGRDQVQNRSGDRVVVQDDFGCPEDVHRMGGEEFWISCTGSH